MIHLLRRKIILHHPTISPGSELWYLAGGIAPANCIAAYQAKGAASYAASKINLANPGTYDAADGGAYPTWNAIDGWIFNGSDDYLTTGITPLNDQTWSAIVRFSNAANTAYTYLFGYYYDNSRGFAITGGSSVIYRNGQYLDTSIQCLSGVLAIAENKGYRNGIADTGTISAGSDALGPFFIGAISDRGSPTAYLACYLQLFAVYDKALSATEVSNLSAAMAAL